MVKRCFLTDQRQLNGCSSPSLGCIRKGKFTAVIENDLATQYQPYATAVLLSRVKRHK